MNHLPPGLRSVEAPAAPAPFGHYAPATVTPDGTVQVSAQLPVGGGVVATSSLADQTRQALVNVLSVVEAAGGRVDSVARVTLYLTDISDWDSADAVFGEVFGTHRPARTVVQVAGLHHAYRVAAEAVGWCPERSDGTAHG
ncbi:2-iminobutanoate/2-iminopropanoate deaminase [Streptomyces sp. KhCrAH-43]|uniref:RidA family protein n=1 Tax=unclassified Streptomyces TaxID=2593676 RepID=UPI00037CFE20|nr:RidA family protein [Streptomyces sp. KhCrAH-43]MYS33349.1 RidA family protein [Streptomyces sp. SID4920]MYX67452.1 RidA family protein [Streptomyces sp. SID8373]RAJ57848.1 2-iminobutanoate/2-iminopropanoate deaminase [Streptomyces sp. KhCrAH-43]